MFFFVFLFFVFLNFYFICLFFLKDLKEIFQIDFKNIFILFYFIFENSSILFFLSLKKLFSKPQNQEPEDFRHLSGFSHLTFLNMDHCSLTHLPKSLSSLSSLKHASFSGNQIKEISSDCDSFPLFPLLESLDLSGNLLGCLPTSFLHSLVSLQTIDLQFNSLSLCQGFFLILFFLFFLFFFFFFLFLLFFFFPLFSSLSSLPFSSLLFPSLPLSLFFVSNRSV